MAACEESGPSSGLRAFMLFVDVGFILYWLITVSNLLPTEWLYAHHDDPVMVAWNWSFLPLDLFISISGLGALWLVRCGDSRWTLLAAVSLAFTVASGANAIAFWALSGDFNWSWWIPNLVLLLGPLPFLWQLLRSAKPRPHAVAAAAADC